MDNQFAVENGSGNGEQSAVDLGQRGEIVEGIVAELEALVLADNSLYGVRPGE